jgi:hypothetical protein
VSGCLAPNTRRWRSMLCLNSASASGSTLLLYKKSGRTIIPGPGGPGVWGESQQFEGVHGISHGVAAGVGGYNDQGGARHILSK